MDSPHPSAPPQPFHSAALAAALLALALAACGASAAFRQGDDAARTGDWLTAVQAYRAALAEDPSDGDTRTRLAGAESSLVDQTSRRVQAFVAANDVDSALAEIGAPLSLLPTNRRLVADLESIRQAGLAEWGAVLQAGQSRVALEGSRRLSASFPNDAQVTTLFNDSAATYGAELDARAQGAEADGLPGLALGLRVAQWSVTGAESAFREAQRLRDGLVAELSITYGVELDGFRYVRGAPALVRPLAVATPSSADSQLRLQATLGEATFDETWRSIIYTQQYLAGTEWVPNPDYGYLQQQLADQQAAIAYADRGVTDAEASAHDAEVERDRHQGQDDYQSYYDRWDQAVDETLRRRDTANHERQQLADLQRQIAATPPTVERDVWADYPYEVREHTRSAQAPLRAVVLEGSTQTADLQQALAASTTDTENDAQPVIGLAADPLRYPATDEDLQRGLEDRARVEIEGLLGQRYDAHRERLRADGDSLRAAIPDRAADRLVRYALLDPSAVAPDVAAWLDETIGLTDVSLLTLPNQF